MEAGYEDRLAGDPVGRIEVVDAAGRVTDVLDEFGGEAPSPWCSPSTTPPSGRPKRRSPNVTLPVALVAVDSRTGAIRAVANNPPGFDRALLGEYAPGSTFKIVTAAGALLGAGLEPRPGPALPVRDPARATRPPSPTPSARTTATCPFIDAFAKSCNTTFVEPGLPARADPAAGDGRDLRVQPGLRPRRARGEFASFPLPESDTETGAASIGQGRVSVTPLHMATVAAAAYDGTWRPPYLSGEPPDRGQP